MNGLEHYKKKDHESISSLNAFCRCPRLYFYQCGCRLAQQEEGIWFSYGTALHMAMPFCLRGDLRGAQAAFLSEWGLQDDREDPKRNTGRALALMENVILTHKDSIYTLVKPPEGRYVLDDTVSQDECPFSLDMGLSVPFVGKIDAIGRHRDTGGLYAVEYKTTSRMGAAFAVSFGYCPQTIAYTIALAMMIEDDRVEGAIIELLGVAKTKAEVMIHIGRIGERQMEEFIDWARTQVGRIVECERDEDWPKNPAGCYPYSMFGCQGFECDYKDLCMVEDWVELKDMFRIREYDLFSSEKPNPDGNTMPKVG